MDILVRSLVPCNESLDGQGADVAEAGGSDAAEGILGDELVQPGDAPYLGKVIEGDLGDVQGSVEVVAFGEIADGLGEGYCSDYVPGVYERLVPI